MRINMSEEKYEQVTRSRKKIFVNNFIGGIAWGIGATIGLAIFLGVSGFLMSKVNLIPVVGTFVSDTYNYVTDTNPRLQVEQNQP